MLLRMDLNAVDQPHVFVQLARGLLLPCGNGMLLPVDSVENVTTGDPSNCGLLNLC